MASRRPSRYREINVRPRSGFGGLGRSPKNDDAMRIYPLLLTLCVAFLATSCVSTNHGRQVGAGMVTLFPRREMLDLVVVNGQARGIVVRNLITGELESHAADAVVISTGGYGNIYYLSTNAESSNVGAIFRAYKNGAMFANPCFTQIHPTCIPHTGDHQSKLTLMSESLRNDGRVWVPHNSGDIRDPQDIPEEDRDYYLEQK